MRFLRNWPRRWCAAYLYNYSDIVAAAIASGLASPPKPRVRIRQDGWIRHDGTPFAFDPDCLVEAVLANGVSYVEPARRWPEDWWRGRASKPDFDILFYRIVAPRQRAYADAGKAVAA